VDAKEVAPLVGDWRFEVSGSSGSSLGALWELVAVVHILNCAQVSFDHFELNCDVWLLVRTYCRGLLGSEELERYRELYENNNDENRQTKWADLLEKFYPDDEYIDAYEGRYDFDDNSKEKAELTHKSLIAYHQLEAYSLHLEDKPSELAAYCEFLVSVLSMVLACIIIFMIIISHYHSAGALQSRGYCQQGAWAANGVHSTGEIQVGSGGGKYGSCRGYGGRWGA
jgi:hypothetical protein